MAVAQLYWHIAPKSEAGIISKSLVRLLRSNRYDMILYVCFLLYCVTLLVMFEQIKCVY